MTFIQVVILIVAFVSVLIWIVIRQDQKKTPKQRKENKVVASTSKKIEEERSFDKLLRERDEENVKRFESVKSVDTFEGKLIKLAVVLSLNFYYFYQVFTDPKFTFGVGGYVLLIATFIACIDIFTLNLGESSFKNKEDSEKRVKELKATKTHSQYPQSSFDDFIAGRMSLAKCFWLYHVLIGFVLAFLCGYFAEVYQQYWLYIFPIAYYAVVTVAVWNCATLYTKDKLENKQPYGWAIATKIFISFNAIVLVGQIILMFSAK